MDDSGISTRALVARSVLAWTFAVALVAASVSSPWIALSAVVLSFGLFTFASGAVGLYAAAYARRGGGDPIGPTLQAAAGIGVAIVTLAMPGLSALVLGYLVAVYAFVTGAIELVTAVRARGGRPLALASGVVSIAFGALLVALPVAGAYALSWLVAAWAFATGAITLAMARRLGRYERFFRRHSAA